jgi:hypothetical protein
VVGRGDQRPPTDLLGGGRVAVVDAGNRSEPVGRDGRRVDGCDGAPEQVVVLGVHHRDLCVGGHDVHHGHQARRAGQVEVVSDDDVAERLVVLEDDVGRPEQRGVRLCLGS